MIIIKNNKDKQYYCVVDVKDDVIILGYKEHTIEIPNNVKYFDIYKGVPKSDIIKYDDVLDPVLVYNINGSVKIDKGQEISDDEYYLYLLNQFTIARYNNSMLSGFIDIKYFYFVENAKLHKVNLEDCEIFPKGKYFVIECEEDKTGVRYSGTCNLQTHIILQILLEVLKIKK